MSPWYKISGRMRTFLSWLWILSLWVSGQLRRAKRKSRDTGTVVLTLHRVLRDDQIRKTASLPGMVVRQTTFDSLMAYLNRSCKVVDLHDPAHPQTGSAKPQIAVTFDDGWSDTARVALPSLRKHSIPATVFVCPDLVDKSMPFWPERLVAAAKRSRAPESSDEGRLPNQWAQPLVEELKRLPTESRTQRLEALCSEGPPHGSEEECEDSTMSWDEVRQLDDAGIAIGSHTLSHQLLLTVPLATAEVEIKESRRVLEDRLQTQCLLFAYPNGGASQELASIARTAGYKTAFINQAGIWADSTSSMLVPRVNVWEGSLVSPRGKFSRLAVEYSVFWAASRATKK